MSYSCQNCSRQHRVQRLHDHVSTARDCFGLVHRCTNTAAHERPITHVPGATITAQVGDLELVWAHSLGDLSIVEDRPRSCDDATGLARACLVQTRSATMMTLVPEGRELDLHRISHLCQVPLRSARYAVTREVPGQPYNKDMPAARSARFRSQARRSTLKRMTQARFPSSLP